MRGVLYGLISGEFICTQRGNKLTVFRNNLSYLDISVTKQEAELQQSASLHFPLYSVCTVALCLNSELRRLYIPITVCQIVQPV